jgi:hypothetical protein
MVEVFGVPEDSRTQPGNGPHDGRQLVNLVIRREYTSGNIRSTVPPWRVCQDLAGSKRPPVTDERFEDPKEAQAWITKERQAGRLT